MTWTSCRIILRLLYLQEGSRMFTDIVIFARENSRRRRHSICLSNWRLTAIITRRCLRGCESCQFPVVVLGSTSRALRTRRNTAVEFSINNVTDKVRRKIGGHRTYVYDTQHQARIMSFTNFFTASAQSYFYISS